MIILDPKTGTPVTLESWPRPQNPDKQWKDLYSAKECARYFSGTRFALPLEIEDILCQKKLFAGDDFRAYPEKETYFDSCRRGPRKHDILMVSHINSLVVGIEAKVNEGFGNLVEAEFSEESESVSSDKRNRIMELMHRIFGRVTIDADLKALRYQLLTATAGTLAEARERLCKKALLLVIVFKTAGSYNPQKIAANKADYAAFTAALGGKEQEPYSLHGYPGIEFYTDYLEIEVP